MITLITGSTLKGKAGTASVISYTINGDSVTTTDAFQVLGQGQLPSSTGDLLTTTPVPASTQYLIKEILGNSTSVSNIVVTFYVNGTGASNTLWQGTVPANGSFSYNDQGWRIYDSNGVSQSVGSTGPAGTITVGTVTNIGVTGPPTVTNVGTGTAAILNFGLQQGATGSTGAPGVVQDVLATDTSITVAGTTAHPTISRAALTGDLTASAGSNTTTLATVNTVTPGTFGSATAVPTITVNGKGLTTASSSTAIQITESQVTSLTSDLALKAPLASPGLTGTPTAPTATPGDSSTKLATTAYVDAAVQGTDTKDACVVATTGNLLGVYLNGSSGVGATFTYTATGTDVIDGVNLTLGVRVLLKDQTSTFQNGIYTVTTAGALGIAGILTRATDFDQSADIDLGDSTFISSGTVNTNRTYEQNGTQSPVMGTDPITFALIGGPGAITSGNGITVTGLSVAIDTSVTVDKTTPQVLTNKSIVATQLTGALQAAQEPAHTGDVTNTAGSLALTLAAGNAGNLNSGTLLAARMPALTGDTTSTVGTTATTTSRLNGQSLGALSTGILKNTITTGVPSIAAAADIPTVAAGGTGPLSATDASVTNARTPTGSITTTAPLTGGAALSTSPTLGISAASTSAAGSQSAAQFNTVQNLWFDVTNYGVSIGNTGAANTAAMNTLISTTAGAGATFFFPQTGANYPFNGAIVVTKNDQKFVGQGQFSSVLFQNSTTDDLFRIQDAVQSTTFLNLGIWSSVTCTAGAAINVGTAAGSGAIQTYLNNVGFQGFGGTWFNCIIFNGNRSGEVGLIEYCQFNSFTNYGIAVIGNTTTPSTTSALVVDNTTMNGQITGTTGAVAGIFVQQSGAFNISNTDVISCTNNLLVAPITSVNQISASIYALNSFFDHSHGSCIKLGGTEPIVRTKFTACSFTISNDAGGNYSAFEVSNTATNPPGDLDLIGCNIQNTFNNTATTNGILLTAVANIKIVGCNINGFTNNLQASAAASSATKLNIVGNSFGPGTVTAPTSTNDILLNSGTYGYVQIVSNVFAPTSPFQTTSTTHLNDLSTTAVGMKNIGDNVGIVNRGQIGAYATSRLALTVSALNLVPGTLIQIPTNSVRVGSRFRFTIGVDKTAAGTVASTYKVKWGTAGTTADAEIASWTSATNTAVADGGTMTIDVTIASLGASATCTAVAIVGKGPGTQATGLAGIGPAPTSTTAFNSAAANPFLHVDITPGTAQVMTASGLVEVLA